MCRKKEAERIVLIPGGEMSRGITQVKVVYKTSPLIDWRKTRLDIGI